MLNIISLAARFGREFTHFVKEGMPVVSKPQYRERIETCNTCEHRKGSKCGLCGCIIAAKARMETSKCPDNPPRWPEIEKK